MNDTETVLQINCLLTLFSCCFCFQQEIETLIDQTLCPYLGQYEQMVRHNFHGTKSWPLETSVSRSSVLFKFFTYYDLKFFISNHEVMCYIVLD